MEETSPNPGLDLSPVRKLCDFEVMMVTFTCEPGLSKWWRLWVWELGLAVEISNSSHSPLLLPHLFIPPIRCLFTLKLRSCIGSDRVTGSLKDISGFL